jgi:hypothetical protein
MVPERCGLGLQGKAAPEFARPLGRKILWDYRCHVRAGLMLYEHRLGDSNLSGRVGPNQL